MKAHLRTLQERLMGADVLAFLAICGALLTKEYFAAVVIALMLITGRVLEKWAEGQAERELKSLLSRMPRAHHVYAASLPIAKRSGFQSCFANAASVARSAGVRGSATSARDQPDPRES